MVKVRGTVIKQKFKWEKSAYGRYLDSYIIIKCEDGTLRKYETPLAEVLKEGDFVEIKKDIFGNPKDLRVIENGAC